MIAGLSGDPPYEYEASIEIDAPPDVVYALVSDLPRMGEWSPENRGGRWLDDGHGTVGDRFEGLNRDGDSEWTSIFEVVTAEKDREFAIAPAGPDAKGATWTYRLDPVGDRTRLTERWRLPEITPFLATTPGALDARLEKTPGHIRATLEGVKAAAEATAG